MNLEETSDIIQTPLEKRRSSLSIKLDRNPIERLRESNGASVMAKEIVDKLFNNLEKLNLNTPELRKEIYEGIKKKSELD